MPIFQLIILTICWLYFLLQGFNLTNSVFGRFKTDRFLLLHWKSFALKMTTNARIVYDVNSSRYGLISIWTFVASKQLFSLPLSRSQSDTCYLFRNILLKVIDFIPCRGILLDQKREKVLIFRACLVIQTQISSLLYLFRFAIKESIDNIFYSRCPICF